MRSWATDVAALANASDAAFHALVVPLASMTKLTYTATTGSYSNASETNSTVPGWERDLNLTANPPAGMRALFFYQPSTTRGVVAFRGTDLDRSTPSGRAVACGDAILANDTLPPSCSREFSPSTLDYWARAVEFVAMVTARHPDLSLLFTGHSLGAQLATMSAASRVPIGPAVAFSTPAWRDALANRTGHAPSAAAARGHLYALASKWDPVQARAAQATGLAGDACYWDEPPAAGCETCFAHGVPSSGPACLLCFEHTHIYAHYLHDLVPGPRPPNATVGARTLVWRSLGLYVGPGP